MDEGRNETTMSEAVDTGAKAEKEEEVVKKGLSVYFDTLASTAVAENHNLKKYQPMKDRLAEVRLEFDGKEVSTLNIANFDDESNAFYHFEITNNDTEIPLDCVHKFSCLIGGTVMEESFSPWAGRDGHKLYFDEDGDLMMRASVNRKVFLTATLTGYAGSREEVEDAIRRNVHTLFFMNLGTFDAQTNEPITFGRDQASALLGARLELHHLSIHSAEFRMVAVLEKPDISENVSSLRTLVKAYPSHRSLQNAVAVAFENDKLRMTKDFFQKVRLVGESREIMSLDVAGGKKGPGVHSHNDTPPSWLMTASEHQQPIPLTRLKGLTLKLGDIALYNARSQPIFGYLTSTHFGFQLKSYLHDTELVFVYDAESLATLQEDLDESTLIARVKRTIEGDHPNITYPDEVTELEDFKVKLLYINIRMDKVQPRMNELGISIPAKEYSFGSLEDAEDQIAE